MVSAKNFEPANNLRKNSTNDDNYYVSNKINYKFVQF